MVQWPGLDRQGLCLLLEADGWPQDRVGILLSFFSGIKNADAIVAGKKKASTLGIKRGQVQAGCQLRVEDHILQALDGLPAFLPAKWTGSQEVRVQVRDRF